MRYLLKTASVSAIMLVTVPGFAFAQSCQSATKVAADIYDKVGTEAIALGCSAVKVALAGEGDTFDQKDLLECYKDASFYSGLTKSLTGWWNSQVAKNAWATIGPRRLTLNTNLDGTLVATTGRQFVSFPMESDNLTITTSERDGRAKTSLVVCKHFPDGKWSELSTRWFNDTNDQQRNDNEVEKVVLTGVKGYEISIHLDAKSVANTFAYTVRASD
jgi:hypothetical protein